MIQVRKRDGHLVPFDLSKIENAILKDLIAIGHKGNNEATAKRYATEVFRRCQDKYLPKTDIFEIENIQDTVVEVLAKKVRRAQSLLIVNIVISTSSNASSA